MWPLSISHGGSETEELSSSFNQLKTKFQQPSEVGAAVLSKQCSPTALLLKSLGEIPFSYSTSYFNQCLLGVFFVPVTENIMAWNPSFMEVRQSPGLDKCQSSSLTAGGN